MDRPRQRRDRDASSAMNDAIVAFQNILARKQVTIAATPEG